jgi:hypothetical protein
MRRGGRMLGKKIILNQRIRKFFIDHRKSAKSNNPLFTADYISVKVGRSKSWLSQVENGRLQSVKTNDIINVFCLLEGRNMNYDADRKAVAEFLDYQIMEIEITQKHGIIKEDGSIPNFPEYLSFQNTRGHLYHAGQNINEEIPKLLDLSIVDIKKELRELIENFYLQIIDWLNRAFSDARKLFSDEISTRNFFLIIKTSVGIYEGHCDYYGLNHLTISDSDMAALKEKLDADCYLSADTLSKPLDEYNTGEIDEVLKRFSTEEYMTWKNKNIYLGDEPFPMVVNYLESVGNDDNFVSYQDINKAVGLSEKNYLYIIKQLYNQVDLLYKKCRYSLENGEELQEEIDSLTTENEELKKQIESMKKKISKYSPK